LSLSPKKSLRSIKFRDDYNNKKIENKEEQTDSNIIKPSVKTNTNETLTKSRE